MSLRVFKPLNEIAELRDGVFLAGPTPRVGVQYREKCEWRQDAERIFEGLGFAGDIIDPVNREYDRADYAKQVWWEYRGMRLASAIMFWIPRTEEHPALTTNIELGEWLASPTTFVGCPPESLHNDYVRERCRLAGKPCYDTLEGLCAAVKAYFDQPMQYYFTSDTHFGAERTLELSARPFRNVQEMDLALISNWNKRVRSKDRIYHLGDFGDFGVLPLLNFMKMGFLYGNYERKDEAAAQSAIERDERIYRIRRGTCLTDREGKRYYMTHEPCFEEAKPWHRDVFWLYGHIHRLQTVKRNGVNVGCDCYRYAPISFREVQFLRGGVEEHFDENVFCERVGETL